jgi:hypothetical protein
MLAPSSCISPIKFFTFALVFCIAGVSRAATVNINPGQDIPTVVLQNPVGTTFIIYPGTYRLKTPIVPKSGDSFIGQTACAPPNTSCPAIISGSTEIGSLATVNGTNYQVTGQTQQGAQRYSQYCSTGFAGCFYPEDLFFDGVPLLHLYATSLPTILTGQWWFDYANHIIYFHDNPSGHLVETSVAPAAFGATNANNVTFQYLTIEEFATPIQTGAIDPHKHGTSTANINWIIRNCEIWGSHAKAVRVNFGTQVYNSYIHTNGQEGIGGGTNSNTLDSGVIIQGNVVSHNNYAWVQTGYDAGGVKFGNTLGAVIRNNTIKNNNGSGIHLDDWSGNALIDGNVVINNVGGGGIIDEIGIPTGISEVIRNNIIQHNAEDPIYGTAGWQLQSTDSTGIDHYCNVLESSGSSTNENNWEIQGSGRVWNNTQTVSSNNKFHHNTIIIDSAGSYGVIKWFLNDAAHQSNFFTTANTPPDYNTYHLPSLSDTSFIYDNNDTQKNARKMFSAYQAAGADVHGTADTNYTSGFPTVVITSPADQSAFTSPAMVQATASDESGIDRVEFYVDWELQAKVGAPPFNFSLTNLVTGSHTVAAMAYSNAGIRNCYAITLRKE